MKRYTITYNVINKTYDGFDQTKEVFIEADKSEDAYEMFIAYCNFYGIDSDEIEIIIKHNKEIVEAKAYTSGSLGWNPDDWAEGEQPCGQDGEPLACLYFCLVD